MRASVAAVTFEQAVTKAGWRCQRCGAHASSTVLELHHVLGRQPCVLVNEPDNLLILCRGCHGWMHAHKGLALDWFAQQFGDERLLKLHLIRRGTKHVGATMEDE